MRAKTGSPITLLFALLCLMSAATLILWLRLNKAPPTWDDAYYLSSSLRMYDALTQRGIPGFLREFQSIFTIRAPLITAMPVPFYFILGRRWHAAFLVNLVALLGLSWGTFQIARKPWGSRAALLAVAIVDTMPLMYGLARWFLVDYALTAIVVVAIWLLLESDNLQHRPPSLLFGVTCGLGLLLKVSFAIFLLPGAVSACMRSRNRANALLAASLCAAVAAPWYAVHIRSVIANALDAGFGESALLQGTGPIFSLHSIGLYLWHVLREGISIYYGGLAAALAIWGFASPAGRSFFIRLGREHTFALLWMLPFLLFLFGGNKDLRYIAPILPAFALILAGALDHSLPCTRAGGGFAFLLCVAAALNMTAVSFGFPFHAEELGYAQHSGYPRWPLDEILTDVSARTAVKPGEKPVVVVGTDRAYFNRDNLELITQARHLPFQIESTAHEKSLASIADRISVASFFIYKEAGEPESPIVNPHVAEAVQMVRENPAFAEIGAGRPLPDGGVAHIFQRMGVPSRLSAKSFSTAELQAPAEFSADFGGIIELTALYVARKRDDIELTYRWRSTGRAQADYWCFTHIVDSQGKILGQLDHPLLDGYPSVRLWQPGSTAVEQMRKQIPQSFTGPGARLKLGIYDPVSGKRLKLERLNLKAEARFSVADDSTALMSRDPLKDLD